MACAVGNSRCESDGDTDGGYGDSDAVGDDEIAGVVVEYVAGGEIVHVNCLVCGTTN